MEMGIHIRYILRPLLPFTLTVSNRVKPWLLLTLLFSVTKGEAKLSDTYNKNNPLTIVCDWELPPYEFLNDNGEPDGFTVELLDNIFNKLGVAHSFLLRNNPNGIAPIEKGRKVVFMIESHTKAKDLFLSSNSIIFYKIKSASHKDTPPIRSLDDITDDELLVLRLDGRFAANVIKDMRPKSQIEYHAPMEALSGVSSGKYKYFIWGEEPLKWKIRELNLENLRLDDIDIPALEIKIAGFDEELIEAFDDQYARLEQNGDLDELRNKWFHPERHRDNASPIALYIIIAAIVLLLVLLFIHRLVSQRVKKMTLQSSEQTRLMNLALDMGGYMISEYNPKFDTFRNVRGQLMNEKSTLDDAFNSLHIEDQQTFKKKVKDLQVDNAGSSEVMLRRHDSSDDNTQWQYLYGNCIKERDEANHTNYILVAKDITPEVEEQHTNDDMAVKYMKAFEISLIAMAFYNKKGKLLEMNNRMHEIIGANEENVQFFKETSLFEAPLFRDFLRPGTAEVLHACQHMYYPDLHIDKYIEYRIRPVFTDDGEIRFYAVTVRDITGERNLYREQLATERQLKVTNEEVNRFESQMEYLLSNCNMSIFRLSIQEGTIKLSRSLRKSASTFTFNDYIAGVAEEEAEAAREVFNHLQDNDQPLNTVRHFTKSPLTGRDAWYAVSGNPMFDENDVNIGYFGVIRDVTQLMLSQEELRHETLRAQQSGAQKTTFLANMTHEIRTPLNAIVGFSDLLHMTTNPDERKEYIHIIRQNCELLLRLIDDILETSDMSEKPQNISPEDIDFATYFDEVCQTVAQRVQGSNMNFIKDNPYDVFPARTDKERIQQVITNFVTNAVKYTKEGYIKVGYRSEKRDAVEGIYLYCEDTGSGIPKEKQASIFDRFVKLNDYIQGTGLGLSICKSIAERCGGSIGVLSEGENMGSTFWLWIPRYLTSSNLIG